MHRHTLILSHPRCGSGYMAQLYQANGYDLRHEAIGKHGTSNWQMAVCATKYPFPGDRYRRQQVRFEQVLHVLRHPLDAVASIAFTERRSEEFRSRYVCLFGNEFEKAILSLVGWNKIIRAQLPHMTIALPLAAQALGFAVDVPPYNARPHDTLTERELQSLVSNDIFRHYLEEKQIYHQFNRT